MEASIVNHEYCLYGRNVSEAHTLLLFIQCPVNQLTSLFFLRRYSYALYTPIFNANILLLWFIYAIGIFIIINMDVFPKSFHLYSWFLFISSLLIYVNKKHFVNLMIMSWINNKITREQIMRFELFDYVKKNYFI